MLAAFYSRTNFQVMIGILPVCEQTYKISMLILPDILSLFNRFLIFVICYPYEEVCRPRSASLLCAGQLTLYRTHFKY